MIKKGEDESSKEVGIQHNHGKDNWPKNKVVVLPESGNRIYTTSRIERRNGETERIAIK